MPVLLEVGLRAPMLGIVDPREGCVEADGFRDRNQRYGYLVARENARCILADPAVLDGGRRHLERFCAGVPQRRHGYALWAALFDEGVEAVAARLTERGERGDYARETAPSFGGLSGPVRVRLLAEARTPLPGLVESRTGSGHDDCTEHDMSNSYTLDPQTEAFVDAAVASGRYNSVADLVGQAVRLLARRDLHEAELDVILSQGLADLQAGHVHDAADVFDELETRYGSPAASVGRP